MTGLAQVQLPPDTVVAEVRRKLACDLYYIQNRGLWLDLRIVLGTATKVVGVPTGVSCRLLGIPSGAVVEENYDWLVSSAQERGLQVVGADHIEKPLVWNHAADAGRALVWGD